MSYRDELDAAHARNQMLEGELAEARREISELKGESQALVAQGDTALTKPTKPNKPTKELLHERTLPGALTDIELAEIAEKLGERLPHGANTNVSVMPGSMTWKGNIGNYMVNIRVSSRRGQIAVRLHYDIAPMGAGAGVLGGAAGLVGMTASAGAIGAIGLFPPALGLLAFLPIAVLTKRALHRRWFRTRKRKTGELFDEILKMVTDMVEVSAARDKGAGDSSHDDA